MKIHLGGTVCLSLACALLAASSTTQADTAAPAKAPAVAPPTMRPAATPRRPNYVDASQFDYVSLLPPVPLKGSTRDEADRQLFLKTRRFKDTPRWVLATSDANGGAADMLKAFSCAVNLELTPASAPAIAKFAQSLTADAGQLTGSAKNFYKRDRPYVGTQEPICRPSRETDGSFDYPSGHTVAGWAWASALAQVAPERASGILARGRAYGESRVVCGVHNMTAVEAGRLAATAVAVLAQPSAQYQTDLAAARAEYATLQQSAPRPEAQRCSNEAALIALPLD